MNGDVSMDGLKALVSPPNQSPTKISSSHTLSCPSLKRTHSYGNLPYNLKHSLVLLSLSLVLPVLA
jgi:hypothetical protein